jgi:hypothetical protein
LLARGNKYQVTLQCFFRCGWELATGQAVVWRTGSRNGVHCKTSVDIKRELFLSCLYLSHPFFLSFIPFVSFSASFLSPVFLFYSFHLSILSSSSLHFFRTFISPQKPAVTEEQQ